MMTLRDYGWTDDLQQGWNDLDDAGRVPARVVADFGTSLKLATPELITAELSGKLAYYTPRDQVPKVGDWVAVAITDSSAVVESVIARRNEITRKVTGKRTAKQIIATNVDIAFVLLALDKDFSIERLERFLYQLSASSIESVIVLNKADKAEDLRLFTNQLNQLSLPLIITTATTGEGVNEIVDRITPAKTAILLGSSGVGKSTLTNRLIGREVQATAAVRESDDTGKHTTVHRELFILPNGGILIDTPGIRELQLWGDEEDLESKYSDITALAAQCKYRNCSHTSEKGCRVATALADGTLERRHYDNYLKLKTELVDLAQRTQVKERRDRQESARRRKDRANDSFFSIDE